MWTYANWSIAVECQRANAQYPFEFAMVCHSFVACRNELFFFSFFFLRWFVFRFERWACSGRLIQYTHICVCHCVCVRLHEYTHRIRRPYSFLVGYFLFIYLFRNLLCIFFYPHFIIVGLTVAAAAAFFVHFLSVYPPISFRSRSHVALRLLFLVVWNVSTYTTAAWQGRERAKKRE